MRLFVSLLTTCFMMLGFGTARAQEDQLAASFRYGVDVPVGGLAQFTSSGTAGSLELSYGVSSRTSLWSGWSVTEVNGLVEGSFPRPALSDIGVLTKHFLVGANVELTEPRSPLRVAGLAGVGVGMVVSEPFLSGPRRRLEKQYPTATLGVEVGYTFFGFLAPYVRTQLFGTFAPDQHSLLFRDVNGFERPFGTYLRWAPALVGLQLEF